jgi:ubiquinone biosynthesis protein UbiJ
MESALAGNGCDLEATLARMEAKLDGRGQKIALVQRRLEARLELLRADLLEAVMEEDRATLGRARIERDAELDALRGEIDTLRRRVEALERG